MNPLKVLVIFDFPIDPPDENYSKYIHAQDWRPTRNIIEALEKLGHTVAAHAIYNSVENLIEKLKEFKPDIVFNMAEAFDGNRSYESNIVALLEMMGIPFTGSSSVVLSLCGNKAYTKRILTPLKVKLPNSVVFPLGDLRRSLKRLKYPVFVKPLGLEGSDGIAQSSFAESKEACLERVKFLHEHHKTDAMVEEYIEGREIYAGLIGNDRLKVLPLREMMFNLFPDDKPKFATFKAKWDKEFRKKWQIKNTFAGAIDEKVQRRIVKMSRSVYRALGIKGYGRLDLRLTEEGEVYLLEVNPNPSLTNDDEVALAAARLGIAYPKLIQKIIELGLHNAGSRHP